MNRIIPPDVGYKKVKIKHPPTAKICPACSTLFTSKWDNAKKRYTVYSSRRCAWIVNRSKLFKKST